MLSCHACPIGIFIHSFIHSFKNLLGAPSRNLLRGAPSPATAIQISLKQPAKRTFIIFRQDTDFQGESIPSILLWMPSIYT